MLCDFTSSTATAIRLYQDIKDIKLTVFVGTNVGTSAGESYIKQAYSVGATEDIKKDGNKMVDIKNGES